MEDKNARVFVASVKNLSKQLEFYGTADTSKLSLLKIIYKYACYSTTHEQLKRLDSMVSTLQRTDKLICMEYQAVNSFVSTSGSIGGEVDIVADNSAPTLSSVPIEMDELTTTYSFTYNDLYLLYSDPEGGSPSAFVINSLPLSGTLLYNGLSITIGLKYADPTLLSYTRNGTSSYSESFTFSAYDDDPQLPLESNVVAKQMNIDNLLITNTDPYVGDRAQYAENRATTVFTVADFTTDTIAAFNDPEGDTLAAIRITEISSANTGKYYYFSTELTGPGQEITVAEIASGAFYHIAPDSNGVTTDSFNADIKTTNSDTWVS